MGEDGKYKSEDLGFALRVIDEEIARWEEEKDCCMDLIKKAAAGSRRICRA